MSDTRAGESPDPNARHPWPARDPRIAGEPEAGRDAKVARDPEVRVGTAAEMLGLSLDTLRRWESEGRLRVRRSEGGQRLVPLSEVTRLLGERPSPTEDAPVPQSARNRFPGIVTRIQRNDPIAVVEIRAGPHRVVSIMTSEAVDELGLEVGREAVGVVKATNVIVEAPAARPPRAVAARPADAAEPADGEPAPAGAGNALGQAPDSDPSPNR